MEVSLGRKVYQDHCGLGWCPSQGVPGCGGVFPSPAFPFALLDVVPDPAGHEALEHTSGVRCQQLGCPPLPNTLQPLRAPRCCLCRSLSRAIGGHPPEPRAGNTSLEKPSRVRPGRVDCPQTQPSSSSVSLLPDRGPARGGGVFLKYICVPGVLHRAQAQSSSQR